MKTTAEDFQDKLAGKQDKHIACGIIKNDIENRGLTLKIHRRKLANSRKIYFIIGYEELDYELVLVANHLRACVIYIRNFFPNAHLTSGDAGSWTIAEY